MNLSKDDLLQIENHIKSNIASWIEDTSFTKSHYFNEIELIERIVRVQEELKSQRELMLAGFEQSNKRFEDMQKYTDKRFEVMQENMDKRFEMIQNNMDKRFEQVDRNFEIIQKNMDKRFEQVDKNFEIAQKNMDKHFEMIQNNMDKRFEDVNSRFTMMFTFMSLGFTILAAMMTIFKFLA